MQEIDNKELLEKLDEAIASNLTTEEKKVLLSLLSQRLKDAETEIDYINIALQIIEILGVLMPLITKDTS